MIGTPVGHVHVEAQTSACICDRLRGCGGIKHPKLNCPEHGYGVEFAKIHSHPLQKDRAYAVDV